MPDLLDGHIFGPGQPCFGCGPDHPIGFRLKFEMQGDEAVSKFTPGEQYQGPPGIMHGGLLSTLIDEVGAWSIIGGRKKFGFTTSMNLKLRKPVRIGRELEARSRITKESTRLVDVEVDVRQGGEICTHAELRFVLLSKANAEKLLGMELPHNWANFTR